MVISLESCTIGFDKQFPLYVVNTKKLKFNIGWYYLPLRVMASNDQFKMFLAFQLPFLHRNPGNMRVYCELMDIDSMIDCQAAERAFRSQNPDADTGWLWSIYKDNDHDIHRTETALFKLVEG